MLYLIHGDQLESSRAKLSELKSQPGIEIRELNGKRLDITALTQALESSSLFGSTVMVVIERYLTNAKKREKYYAKNLAVLLEACTTVDIILYEEKEIDKATVTKLGSKAKVFLFKTPVVLFQFLDSLAPNNAKHSLVLYHDVVGREPAEIVFSMICRRVRQLIQCRDNVVPDGLKDWQLARLTNQAGIFTMDKLVAMHANLLDVDIAIKSGSSPFTLGQHLEQFLISL